MSDNRTAILVELCRIMRDYGLDVDNAWTNQGTIAQPGKFEGEPIETLYFYSEGLNGMGEAIGDWDVHPLTETDRRIFGFAPEIKYFAVRSTDQGFVLRAELTEADYQQIIDEDNADAEYAANEDA